LIEQPSAFWDSGDDIGDELILEHLDFVFQTQFAFLEAGHLELVGRTRGAQRVDCRIEIAMLLAQGAEPGLDLPVVARHNWVASPNLSTIERIDHNEGETSKGFDDLLPLSTCESMQRGELRMDQSHSIALEAKHARLDRKIEEEAGRPAPNTVLIAQLKKEKLKIKDTLIQVH
jgi:hypothetical protein